MYIDFYCHVCQAITSHLHMQFTLPERPDDRMTGVVKCSECGSKSTRYVN